VADSGSVTRFIGRRQAEQQPRGGAGIAHVEHVGRFHQPAHAAAGDAPGAGAGALHLRPQGAHGGGRAQHVLAFQQPRDLGGADGDGAEHQGAVADGFVAGHAEPAGERAAGRGGAEGAGIGMRHGRRLTRPGLAWQCARPLRNGALRPPGPARRTDVTRWRSPNSA
jgi:hypothetical protein